MKRLKNSIIKKSNKSIFTYKEMRLLKIYRFARNTHGGQFQDLPGNAEVANEIFETAQQIKGIIEKLAIFLKK